jgi:hypothetical protein
MRSALDPAGHRVPRTKPTCLLHTWRPHRRRPFALVLHLHQHESSRNLHLQYLAKNQSTQRCQSLITQGSDHPPVLEPHMVLNPATHALCQPRRAPRVLVFTLPAAEIYLDYFASTARPGASARRAARHAARRTVRRRLLCLAQARRRLLHRASGCLGTSRGSSCGSSRRLSSTTLPRPGSSSTTPPRVRVPPHAARLVMWLVAPLIVDYFAYAARPGALAHRAARHTAHRRLLRAPRLRLAATLALLQPRRAW